LRPCEAWRLFEIEIASSDYLGLAMTRDKRRVEDGERTRGEVMMFDFGLKLR